MASNLVGPWVVHRNLEEVAEALAAGHTEEVVQMLVASRTAEEVACHCSSGFDRIRPLEDCVVGYRHSYACLDHTAPLVEAVVGNHLVACRPCWGFDTCLVAAGC